PDPAASRARPPAPTSAAGNPGHGISLSGPVFPAGPGLWSSSARVGGLPGNASSDRRASGPAGTVRPGPTPAHRGPLHRARLWVDVAVPEPGGRVVRRGGPRDRGSAPAHESGFGKLNREQPSVPRGIVVRMRSDRVASV